MTTPNLPTLQYGMKIQLFAKSPQGVDPKANYGITQYDKHGLIVLDETAPITWTLVPAVATQQEVCYGDKIILVDDRGMVMNGHDTGTWGKGYISLKDRSVAGELHFHFSRPAHPLNKGSPILLGDITQGNKLHLHAFIGKGSSLIEQQSGGNRVAAAKQPISVERKGNSGCKGGYLRFNGTGSGQVVGFDIKIVSTKIESPLLLQIPSQQQQPQQPQPQPQPQQQPQQPQQPQQQPQPQQPPLTPLSPSVNRPDGFHPDEDKPSSISPGDQHRYHAAGENIIITDPNNPLSKRPYNPDSYDARQEVLPLRYGDKVKLIARSPYNPDGGAVGLYRKHDLVGAGPIISTKTGQPVDDGDDEDFSPSEFIICGTGDARTGDIVRYSSHLVLIDANNGNAIWNCLDTDTWSKGYIAEGPVVQNGVNPSPGTPGPPLVSSNFNQITQGGKLPSGQIHISFQPETSSLLGYPIHNKDSNVFIDVENTHQKRGKLNCRLSVYKKKSSMLVGGYLICIPNSGKPVSFTLERTQHVPLQRRSAYIKSSLIQPTGYVEESTIHYRRTASHVHNYRSRERKKFILAAFTALSGLIAFMYFTSRYGQTLLQPHPSAMIHINDNNNNITTTTTTTTTTTITPTNPITMTPHNEMMVDFLGYSVFPAQYLYYKQIIYIIVTLICAMSSVVLNSSSHISPSHQAQAQQDSLVSVEVERNTLSSIIQDAQSLGKAKDPNQWMIDAGLDPDHIEVPPRYINAEKGDKEKGKKRFLVTTKWRYINDITTILNRPHPLFRIIKRNTVQFFYGKDLKGNCVYYETPKAANLGELDRLGVSIQELLFHFVYITEYLYQHLDTREDARCLSVVDINGISMTDFGGEVVEFVQQVAKITQTHYPERSAGILCINAGWAFQLLWKVVSNMMDPVTRSKTHLWGSDFINKMTEIVPADQIPKLFGGQGNFVPTIPTKGPNLPPTAIESKFNAIEIDPLSVEEQTMFTIADNANNLWIQEHPGEMLPRPLLKDKLPQ